MKGRLHDELQCAVWSAQYRLPQIERLPDRRHVIPLKEVFDFPQHCLLMRAASPGRILPSLLCLQNLADFSLKGPFAHLVAE